MRPFLFQLFLIATIQEFIQEFVVTVRVVSVVFVIIIVLIVFIIIVTIIAIIIIIVIVILMGLFSPRWIKVIIYEVGYIFANLGISCSVSHPVLVSCPLL